MAFPILSLLIPAAMATFNPQTPRGEQIVSIANGKAEICVIPKKFPGAVYSERDLKQEKKLCALDNETPVAQCPKVVSTNPAVEFFSIPNGMTRDQVEAKNCDVDGAKKLAKYKNSISCSYTPSLLAYYHISRILGDINQVPPVVIRTFDLNHHREIAKKGIAVVSKKANSSLLLQIWQGFASHLNAPATSSKKDALFVDGLKQSYGALQENPRKEEKYSEMFFAARGSETRADAFRDRSPIYKLLASPRSLRELVPNQWAVKNVQTVQQMKDVADMIVLDTMLNQEDRFGNVHYTMTSLVVANTDHGQAVVEGDGPAALPIKKMMLKDNDCGVNRGNNSALRAGLLKGMSHISPETYKRVLKLNQDMKTAAGKEFFIKETLMTEKDYQVIAQNVDLAASTLQKSCRARSLQLDLDLNAHFANAPVSQACE